MMGNLFSKYFVLFKDTLRYIFEDKNTQGERLGCKALAVAGRLRANGWKRTIRVTVIIYLYSANMHAAQAPNLYTQSQAHLRLKTVRDLLGKEFSNKIVPYFDIISQVLTREAIYKNSYYVFYHTTSSKWTVVADLFAQLHVYFKPEDKVSSAQIMSEEFKADGLIDDAGHLALLLLSVNFALFGNVGSQAENTWKSFIKDVQASPSAKVYEKMMDIFGLTHKYIPEMLALEQLIHTPEASLLQIFVPQKEVDQVIYLAWIDRAPSGVAFSGDQSNFAISRQNLEKTFKNEQKNNPKFQAFMKSLHAGKMSAYAFLKDYCNKPLELENINKITGRMLLAPEGLLDFGSGIILYRYVTTPREKIKEYMAKLEVLVQKLIADKK